VTSAAIAVMFGDSEAYSDLADGSNSDESPTEMQTSLLHHYIGPSSRSRRAASRPKTNWSLPHNKERINTCLREWIRSGKGGKRTTSETAHCGAHGVPRTVFKARLMQSDPFDVPILGRPPLWNHADQSAIVDAVTALDRLIASITGRTMR
jgi:hypothetical protein